MGGAYIDGLIAGGFYDDIDDYSPVVSDIEEDLSEDNAKGSVEHAKQGASYDLLQQILNENEQSTTKSVLEDENLMEADEPEEEGKLPVRCFLVSCILNRSFSRWRERAKCHRHVRKEENHSTDSWHPVQRCLSLETCSVRIVAVHAGGLGHTGQDVQGVIQASCRRNFLGCRWCPVGAIAHHQRDEEFCATAQAGFYLSNL